MKQLQLHVAVDDLAKPVRFYPTSLAAKPSAATACCGLGA